MNRAPLPGRQTVGVLGSRVDREPATDAAGGPWLTLVFVGTFAAAVVAGSGRVGGNARLAFGGYLGVAIVMLTLSRHRRKTPKAVMALVALGFGPAVVLGNPLGEVFGDAASLLAIAVVASFVGGLKRASNARFVAVLSLAGLIPAVVAWKTATTHRFEPPDPLVLAATAAFVADRSMRRVRLPAVAVALFVLYLSIRSGFRTATMSWFIVMALAIAFPLFGKKGAASILRLLVVVAGVALPLALLLSAVKTNERSFQLSSNDASLSARIAEAHVVLTQVNDHIIPPTVVVGHGHGATFDPRGTVNERNLDQNGLAHHIHITPVNFLYRYGLIGFAVAVGGYLFAGKIVTGVIRGAPVPPLVFFLAITFALDTLVRNSLPSPFFSLGAGIAISAWHER